MRKRWRSRCSPRDDAPPRGGRALRAREAITAAHRARTSSPRPTSASSTTARSSSPLGTSRGKSLREVIAKGRLDLGARSTSLDRSRPPLPRARSESCTGSPARERHALVRRDGDPDFVKVLDFGIAKVQIGELTAGRGSPRRAPRRCSPGGHGLRHAGYINGAGTGAQPVDSRRRHVCALRHQHRQMLCGVSSLRRYEQVPRCSACRR